MHGLRITFLHLQNSPTPESLQSLKRLIYTHLTLHIHGNPIVFSVFPVFPVCLIWVFLFLFFFFVFICAFHNAQPHSTIPLTLRCLLCSLFPKRLTPHAYITELSQLPTLFHILLDYAPYIQTSAFSLIGL